MRRRDRMKERFSRVFGNGSSNRADTTDPNGQRLHRQQENREPNKPQEEEGLNESSETPKSRRMEDTPIQELWNVAYEKLREEDGKLIEEYEAKLIGSVTTGLGQTLNLKQNRREWMQAILNSKMEEVDNKLEPSSLQVQAKDAMQLVLNIVNSAKDYIGNAASANPYTSIAWTGVSFFLPLLMNVTAEQASLVKGLQYIVSLIIQSRMREELYVECYEKGRHSHERFRQSHTQYKTALEKLYTYILKFQATACCHYSKSSALRHAVDAVKWKDWVPRVDEIREQDRNFAAVEELWRDIQRYEMNLAKVNTFSEMNAKLSALADDAFADLLNWLCDVDPSPMYNTGLDRREAGTCEWLIKNSEEFKTWEASDGSLLWLHGKAGSGKSILSSSVIKHLRDRYVSELSTVVSYFYFSFSDPEKQKVDVMLASLIKQICSRQTKRSQLMERLGQYKIKGERPDTETLEAVLIASASEFASLYIIIDALDECPLLNEQRRKLLKSLRRILAMAPTKFHFFLTSRKEPDIDNKIRPILSSTDKIEIDLLARQQIINMDIRHYINSQLSSDEYNNWPKNIKDEARESLVEKADCMFQYVRLQLEALQSLSSESDIREALRNLPTGLDATYNRVLESIPPSFKERVIHSLKWLAFSMSVLYIKELAEIFTIRPHNILLFDETERPFSPLDILKYFSGLVITQGTDPWIKIRLVHFSLKEYLISERITQGSTLAFSFNQVNAHISIVQSCLAYLNHFSYWVAVQPIGDIYLHIVNESYPLAEYAVLNWMAHLEEIPRDSWSPDIKRDAARTLAVHSQSLLTLLKLDRRIDHASHIKKPYCYTAWKGHFQLTKMLIHQKPGSNKYVMREELDEALQQMAYEGKTDAMQVFLEAGADVNAQRGEWGSALQAAATRGYLNALKLLVSRGANVNSSSNKDECLLTCVPKGATACLQFLLDNDADINMTDKRSRTALHKAAMDGDDAQVDLLLERGANTNALADCGTPLQAVCKDQSPQRAARYVKKLLENGADPNLRSGENDTALQLACDNQDLFPNRQVAMEIVQLLLKNGTVESWTQINEFCVVAADKDDEDDKNDEDNTPKRKRRLKSPHRKRKSRHRSPWIYPSAVEVVKLLLESDARIEEALPLHMACIRRDEERVRWLLEQGADVNGESDLYGTPLHAVLTCEMFGSRVVRLLTWDPSIMKRISENTVPIVQLLIRRGAPINQIGGKYGTALQAVCSNPSFKVEMARFLLEQKADVNAKGGQYGTALITACGPGRRRMDVVRLLLEHNANVNATGGRYGTALAAACKYGDPELVRLLLEHGANMQQRDYAAWNAVGLRSLYGNSGIEILETLLGQVVSDTNHRQRGLATALNSMLEIHDKQPDDEKRKWHEIFCWLLKHGADVNVKGGKSVFALQTACARETGVFRPHDINAISRTTKFLLEQCPNIDVNTQGGIFGSALQAAAFSGQTESVRLLLDRGADVNARGGKCGSALNAAIFRGYWDIVEILLQRGAAPDYRLQQQPDEEWLQRVREKWSEEMEEGWRKDDREADWRYAIARYRKFWEVEGGSAAGAESSS